MAGLNIEIGLTANDINKLFEGEKLLCYWNKEEENEIYIKCWDKPNTFKVIQI